MCSQYWEEMNNVHVDVETGWIVMSSDSTTNLVEEIKANIASERSPNPFRNSSIEEVYDFFKNHVRPADDDPLGYVHTFTYFTFLVIDAECVKAEPFECVSFPMYHFLKDPIGNLY